MFNYGRVRVETNGCRDAGFRNRATSLPVEYTVQMAHRIRLDPNEIQRAYFVRAAGAARFAYNWGLVEWGRQYTAWKAHPRLNRPCETALRRQLNSIKRDQLNWMLDVTKCAPQMAIIQLGRAFENFLAGRACYPTFRRKGIDDRFTLTNDQAQVEGKRLWIPKLGWVRMREALRFVGHVLSVTVSRKADHWYASIAVAIPDAILPSAENQGTVGIDLGISRLATLSTGESVDGPKALRRLLGQVRRLSRALARKVKDSANWSKAKTKLARLHERISNIRRDSLHKLSTSLTRRFHTIVIEDLKVKGMLRSRKIARSLSDMGFYQFRRQLEYKVVQRGGRVVVADRWYPSSKTCSQCSYLLDQLALTQRNWTCPDCGALHDRDINAAINLMNMAVSSTVTACGGEGAGLANECQTKPAPLKQEFNRKINRS